MSRGTPAGFATAMSQPHVTSFPLVDMQLDGGWLYVCGAPFSVTYGGHTYLPDNGLGSIEEIKETDGEVAGLAFTLAGVQPSQIATMLTANIQGLQVIVRQAVVDSTGTMYVDDNVWTGLLDQMQLVDSKQGAAIRVTAEHRMIRWRTPKVVRMSNEDQQRLHPGDKFFEYAAQTAEQVISWPYAVFFQQ